MNNNRNIIEEDPDYVLFLSFFKKTKENKEPTVFTCFNCKKKVCDKKSKKQRRFEICRECYKRISSQKEMFSLEDFNKNNKNSSFESSPAFFNLFN